MGYFGGLGAGKGWHKFHFLLTAGRLEEAFTAHEFHIVDSGPVPADYEETALSEYVDAYRCYCERLVAPTGVGWEAEHPLRVFLSRTLAPVQFIPCRDPKQKYLECSEPMVAIAPLQILFNGKTLSLNAAGVDFGLTMSFPKVVSFSADGHETLHETDQFANHSLFFDLKKELARDTKPCAIDSPVGKHRTRVRISPACKEWINGCRYLKRENLRVV